MGEVIEVRQARTILRVATPLRYLNPFYRDGVGGRNITTISTNRKEILHMVTLVMDKIEKPSSKQ